MGISMARQFEKKLEKGNKVINQIKTKNGKIFGKNVSFAVGQHQNGVCGQKVYQPFMR